MSSLLRTGRTGLALSLLLIVAACSEAPGGNNPAGGNGGGGGGGGGSSRLVGMFVDHPVEGLQFSGSSSLTNRQGEFTYRQGGTIRFFIGSIELGSAKGMAIG